MKIAHFHFGKEGGAERFFVRLVNAFHERGFNQKVTIRPGRLWQNEIEDAAELNFSHFPYLSPDRLLLPMRVQKMVKSWKPDVLFAWMPRAARLLPKNNTCLKVVRLGDYPRTLDHFKNADVIICITPELSEFIKDMGWNRGNEVISNFTDTPRATPVSRSNLDIPENAFVASSMGRFVELKGFKTLIEALVIQKDMYLILAGDGDEGPNLKALATKLGVMDRIRFVGWHKDPTPYVAASNVFAMPSRHETLGNVVFEAWSQQVPLVSTRSQGPSWAITDQHDGIMVDIDDAEGFANAFERLQNEDGLSERLVAAATNTLETKFSRRAITDTYVELFKRYQ